MDRETVYLYILVRPLEFSQPVNLGRVNAPFSFCASLSASAEMEEEMAPVSDGEERAESQAGSVREKDEMSPEDDRVASVDAGNGEPPLLAAETAGYIHQPLRGWQIPKK